MSSGDEGASSPGAVGRRAFLLHAAVAGAATAVGGAALAQGRGGAGRVPGPSTPAQGLLAPQQNLHRNLLDLSGTWQFQLDPRGEGEAQGWSRKLPAPRPIAVPASWNDLFDDAHNYFGLAWYLTETWLPPAWRGQRVFLRVGSANYAAQVWLDGVAIARHEGGHLPFVVELTEHLAWDRRNVLAISVENEQRPERVPHAPSEAGGLFAGPTVTFPATTFDFFPYSGLHRPVVLFTTPAAHIDDVTVVTALEGKTGVVSVEVVTAGGFAGQGRVRLGDVEAALTFRDGAATAKLRVPNARLWSPGDPHLYPLTVTLEEGGRAIDSYALEIGIRTVEVRGAQLLLNGQPIQLTGCGRHEDFPINGRGFNAAVMIRDHALLQWLGANSYRTTHYPHSEEAMALADRLGFLLIDEIPAVSLNFADSDALLAQRLAQCQRQLGELIARDKNHPCVLAWCIANEPMVGAPAVAGGPPADPRGVQAGLRFFRTLHAQARGRDPTRPVMLVGVQGGPPEWLGVPDLVGINRYYGWYAQQGQLEEAERVLERELDALHAAYGKPIVLTEFGTDTLPGNHRTPPEMWSEEYQVEFLRRYLAVTARKPFVVGTQVWAFADFRTGQGTMRAAGMNFKGVFTRERQPKMAAHFLRSRWVRS